MAYGDAYSDATLKAYMADGILGPVADNLGWTVVDGDFDEPLNDVLTLADETLTASIAYAKARALAAVAIWRQVVRHTTGDLDFEADGAKVARSKLRDNAVEQLAAAEDAASEYLTTEQIVMKPLSYDDDPYQIRDGLEGS